MDIEYARKMTDEEVSSFFKNITRKQEELKHSSIRLLVENEKEIIDSFLRIEKEISAETEELLIEYRKDMRAYDEDKCTCGAELVYIPSGDFYGCKNYKSPVPHRNFKKHRQNNYRPDFRPSRRTKSYLLEIINELGLRDKLNQKRLLLFLVEKGYSDIRYVYGSKSSFDDIDNFKDANTVSKKYEDECHEELSHKFPTCIKQFPIKYKIKGDKERCCFIDILCSDEKEVVIYECKTNSHDVREEQNHLYLSLIKFMNTTDRKVRLENLIMRPNG